MARASVPRAAQRRRRAWVHLRGQLPAPAAVDLSAAPGGPTCAGSACLVWRPRPPPHRDGEVHQQLRRCPRTYPSGAALAPGTLTRTRVRAASRPVRGRRGEKCPASLGGWRWWQVAVRRGRDAQLGDQQDRGARSLSRGALAPPAGDSRPGQTREAWSPDGKDQREPASPGRARGVGRRSRRRGGHAHGPVRFVASAAGVLDGGRFRRGHVQAAAATGRTGARVPAEGDATSDVRVLARPVGRRRAPHTRRCAAAPAPGPDVAAER